MDRIKNYFKYVNMVSVSSSHLFYSKHEFKILLRPIQKTELSKFNYDPTIYYTYFYEVKKISTDQEV